MAARPNPISWMSIGSPASGMLLTGQRIRGKVTSAIRQSDKMVEIETPVGVKVWVTLESVERIELPTLQSILDSFKGLPIDQMTMANLEASLAPGRELLDLDGFPNEIGMVAVEQRATNEFNASITFKFVRMGMVNITFEPGPEMSLPERMERLDAVRLKEPVVVAVEKCGSCRKIHPAEALHQAPALEGGQTVAPWCELCLSAYEASWFVYCAGGGVHAAFHGPFTADSARANAEWYDNRDQFYCGPHRVEQDTGRAMRLHR